LIRDSGGRIGLIVLDGLGGLPHPGYQKTELEAARTPNLDRLALTSSLGRVRLLPEGMTPGSGPGHMSLFGYDPLTIDFGRGLFEALGSGYPLNAGEVAARGNFCTIDGDGKVSDRRAGRPPDEECLRLCEQLQSQISIDGVQITLLPGKEHRFTLVLTGKGLGAGVNDNDPQVTGKAPLDLVGSDDASKRTAAIAREFLLRAGEVLSGGVASGILLRGFSSRPQLDGFPERFGVRGMALAIYPMYRGVARLVGMEAPDCGPDLAAQIEMAASDGGDSDFIFIHFKDTDTAGHSGDFDGKVAAIERFDAALPGLLDLGLDVIAITGDHSTPATMKEHSWHPVPLLVSSAHGIPVEGQSFDERGVLAGDLGTIPGPQLMPLLLAHAGRLDKYGA